MIARLVIMGVAGCGKSSVGAAVADLCALALIEGDDFHAAASRDKMQRGIALTDDDRHGWLDTLGQQLAQARGGCVLTCSALKRTYRDQLRAAAPDLRFVYLRITPADARARVAARGDRHIFSPTLVDSQFAALEPPTGEPGVLDVDALAPVAHLAAQIQRWLETERCK